MTSSAIAGHGTRDQGPSIASNERPLHCCVDLARRKSKLGPVEAGLATTSTSVESRGCLEIVSGSRESGGREQNFEIDLSEAHVGEHAIDGGKWCNLLHLLDARPHLIRAAKIQVFRLVPAPLSAFRCEIVRC